MTALLDAVAVERARLAAERYQQFLRYTVEICEPDLTPIGPLNGMSELEFVDRYCDVGSGKVNAPASDGNRVMLKRGGVIVVHNGGTIEHVGLYDRNESHADVDTIKLNWKTPEEWLRRRVAYPDPLHPWSSQTKASDDQTGFTSSVIFHYVNLNAGPQALPDRRIGGLGLGIGIAGDPGVGAVLTVPVQAAGDNLLELIRRLAVPGGVGFRIETHDRGYLFVVYQVSDLSQSVVYSSALRTLGTGDAGLSAPGATTMLVLGEGTGVDQARVEVSTDELSPWGRIEAVMTDKGTPDVLAAAGRRALAEKGETLSCSFEAVAGAHEADVRLGDLVTVVPWPGETAVKPLMEKRTKVTAAEGRKVTYLAGDYGSTTGTQSQAQMREQIRLIQKLVRR